MADDNQGAAQQPANQPTLNNVGMYIRDLSFENPTGAQSMNTAGPQPRFTPNIALKTQKMADDTYSVEMTVTVKAERDTGILFNLELVYGGLFQIKGFTDAQLPQVLLVECPRLIFPFARQIVANTIQQGGFPPVMLPPVDFQGMFRQQAAAALAQIEKLRAQTPAN